MDDLISRKAAIDKDTNVPSNDCISREAALGALDKRFDSIPMEQTTEILLLRKDLRNLPSAQPQRMRGRWIEYPEVLAIADALDDTYIGCSCCKNVFNIFDNDTERFLFCPNCGADMRESINV